MDDLKIVLERINQQREYLDSLTMRRDWSSKERKEEVIKSAEGVFLNLLDLRDNYFKCNLNYYISYNEKEKF